MSVKEAEELLADEESAEVDCEWAGWWRMRAGLQRMVRLTPEGWKVDRWRGILVPGAARTSGTGSKSMSQ